MVVGYIYGPDVQISEHTSKPINNGGRQHTPIFWCVICNLKLGNILTSLQHLCGARHKKRHAKQAKEANPVKPNDVTGPVKRKGDPVVEEQTAKKSRKGDPVVEEQTAKKSKKGDPVVKEQTGKKSQKGDPVVKEQTAKKRQKGDPVVKEQTAKKSQNGDPVVKEQTTKKSQNGDPVVKEQTTKKSKVQAEQNIKCDDCNIEFGSKLVQALQHFKSKKHAAKIGEKLGLKTNQVTNRSLGRGSTQGFQGGGQSGGQRGRGGGMGSGAGRGRGSHGFERRRGLLADGINKGGRFDIGSGYNRNVPATSNTNSTNVGKSSSDINDITLGSSTHGKPPNNFVNTTMESFRNNPTSDIDHNVLRKEYHPSDMQYDNFYGKHVSSNYGSSQYETRDVHSKEYFTSVGSQKDSGTTRDWYHGNNEASPSSAAMDTLKDNFRGGNYHTDFGIDRYSTSINSYQNPYGNNSSSFLGRNEMNNDRRYDTFYSENY